MKNLLCFALICILFSSLPLFASQWEITKRVEPRYPLSAVRNNQEGCVRLQYFINSDGVPVYVEPIKSSPKFVFDNAAIKAVSQWRYTPSTNNSVRQPERQTVELTFATANTVDINNNCFANMTVESNDIDVFKKQRLSAPIDANDVLSLITAINKITTVLPDHEARSFEQIISALLSEKGQIIDNDRTAKLESINGLNYYQVINSVTSERDMQLVDDMNKNPHVTPNDIDKLPQVSIMEFYQLWNERDMAIMMPSNSYNEISYHLLKIELMINSNGTAKLLSTCRAVSEEVKAALLASISDWNLIAKKQPAKAVRYIWGVPAPVEDGAFYQCDDNWYPEHQLEPPRIVAN